MNLGQHIFADLKKCNPQKLNDSLYIESIMKEAASLANATILNVYTHKFTPQGVTVVIALAESHFTIHTYPEYGCALADFFTCGDHTLPEEALKFVSDSLDCDSFSFISNPRGLVKDLVGI